MKMLLLGLIGLGWFANTMVAGKLTQITGIKQNVVSNQAILNNLAKTKQDEKKTKSPLDPIVLLAQEDTTIGTLSSQLEQYSIGNTLNSVLEKSTRNLSEARAQANASGDKGKAKVNTMYPSALALESGSEGGKIDNRRAVLLYQKAAEQGEVRAQSRLGVAYMRGQLGLEKDFALAEKWLTEAAIHNDLNAQYYLGKLLLKDRETNIVDALVWVAVAAKRGYEPAQAVVKNYWFRLNGAEQDDLLARVKHWKIGEKNLSVA
jgi:TPR repeat protein